MLLTTLIAFFALFPTDPAILTVPIAEAAPSALQMYRRAWLDALEACEDPSGDPAISVLDVNERYSYRVLQFQVATWGKRYGIETTRENVFDPALQEEVASHILDDGGWR